MTAATIEAKKDTSIKAPDSSSIVLQSVISQSVRDSKNKYEREKRGKTILKVVLSQDDDAHDWECIKNWLKSRGNGNMKEGIMDLWLKEAPKEFWK